MKVLFLLFLLILPTMAQERQSRRAINLPPQLLEDASTHVAAGLAQSPSGAPIIIDTRPIPRGLIVSLFGTLMRVNGVREVLLVNVSDGKEYVLPGSVSGIWIPKLERVAFRLPNAASGEVWVRTIGIRESNWVRFYVE